MFDDRLEEFWAYNEAAFHFKTYQVWEGSKMFEHTGAWLLMAIVDKLLDGCVFVAHGPMHDIEAEFSYMITWEIANRRPNVCCG